MIVYMIRNKINKKIYIGQTIHSLETRFRGHCSNSKCTYMKRAITKYGKENFEIKVLSTCNTQEEMDYRETYYIKLFKSMAPNGYNLKTEGKGGTLSEITRKKIGDKLRGRKTPLEIRLKISLAGKGRKGVSPTEDHKNKLRLALTGLKKSEEFCENLRLSACKTNRKKVININTGEVLSSAKELSVKINMIYSTLINKLNETNPNDTEWIYLTGKRNT